MSFEWRIHDYTATLEYEGDKPTSDEEALALAILKWETIVEKLKESTCDVQEGGLGTCGLCMRHMSPSGHSCNNCPVQKATGISHCECTPYDDWDELRTLANAEAELEFLKGLTC